MHIAVLTGNNTKSTRDNMSGLLRYVAENKPGWNVRFFPGSTTATRESWQRIVSPWKPDCVVFLAIQWVKFRPPIATSCKIAALSSGNPAYDCLLPKRTLFVGINDSEIASKGASLLIRRGLTHFAFIHSDTEIELARSKKRYSAFAKFLHEKGFDCYECGLPGENSPNDWSGRLSALASEIASLPNPCGIMAYSDNVARLAIDACNYALVSIPKQVQIVGVDNQDDICLNVRPRLTSIEPDFEGAGYCLARLVDKICFRRNIAPEDDNYDDSIKQCGVRRLAERETTLDLSGAVRIATVAERLIDENACSGLGEETQRGLTPMSLAKSMHVSRRLLELRFREVRNEGVAVAIRRRKLIEVKRLLRETDLPIWEIASICGFPSQTHLNALFRRTFNCTPNQWRHSSL